MLVSIVCVVCALALAISSAFTFWPVTAWYDFYRPLVMFIAGYFAGIAISWIFIDVSGRLISSFKKKKLKTIKNKYVKSICKTTADEFLAKLDGIKDKLDRDLNFFFDSDPAADSKDEIIMAYPGFMAIAYYRVAHELYKLGVNYVPRIITEIAHSKTGIDIHPACKIGCPFFIDHGTGIVVGETSEIGNYVKMYHGVTLGALSLEGGQALHGVKRHPTIKDYVTIYSGASILGGETVIEERAVIGSNVFIVNSVVKDTKVIYLENHVKINK